MKRLILLVLFAMLMVTACEPRKAAIEPVLNRTGQPIQVTVFFYDSQAALNRAYRTIHNLPSTAEIPNHWGFARWPEWFDSDGQRVEQTEYFSCQIHVMRPQTIDDQRTLSLGHEMLHCLYGSYH